MKVTLTPKQIERLKFMFLFDIKLSPKLREELKGMIHLIELAEKDLEK